MATAERVNSPDGNSFDVLWNGKKVLHAVRETLDYGKRGNWLLFMESATGKQLIVARDQYSNDLMEIAQMHCDGTRPFGGPTAKFRIECSKAEYFENISDWLLDIEFQFGGDWVGDYYEWENRALLIRKATS
jgi:hypothetical protein